MKKFILKSLLFGALILTVIGGVCVAEILAEIKAYRKEVVLPSGSSIVICGDSQLGNAVDPSVCPKLFNFSAHGRTLDQSYLTMLDVLDAKENAGRVKKVVFDVSPSSLTWLAGKPAGDLDFSGKYFLIYLLHWKEAKELRCMDGWLGSARDNLVGRRLRLFWRTVRGKGVFRSSLYGSFTPKDEALLIENQKGFEGTVKLKVGHAKGFEGVMPGTGAFLFLDRVVEAAKARSVELVLTTSPWHEDLLNACGADRIAIFERRLQEYAASHGCRYVNLLHGKFPTEAWMDANHLNAVGARIFTPAFLDVLEKAEHEQ